MTGDDSLEAEVPTKWVNFIVKAYEHFGFPPLPT